MPIKDRKFADKILQHLDKLDNASLQSYLLRLINDKGFLESIFNTIREAVIVVDGHLNIQFVNSACKPMLGISQEDVGKGIASFFRMLPWQQLLDKSSRIPSASRREIEIFYPEHRFLSFYLMPITDEHKAKQTDIPLATLIFQDVTESIHAQEINLETQKVKAITQLAAGVAHELGNPLNSLGIHLQLMQRAIRKMPKDDATLQLEDFVKTASNEVKRLDSIVKNFLAAVRPVPLTPQPVNIQQLLTAAVTFMKNEILARNIAVDCQSVTALPTIFGDPDQLTQAFFNIIKNAIQAMPDGGQLFIICSTDDIYLNIKFIDTGKGISEEEMRQILDPYFTTKSSGTGLGLLIVDRIIRAHGGTLAIEGEPGKGAAFTVSLPLQVRQTRLLN